MKYKSILISLLLCASLLLNGCNTVPGDDTKSRITVRQRRIQIAYKLYCHLC